MCMVEHHRTVAKPRLVQTAARRWRYFALVVCGLLLAGWAESPSVLNPRGSAARRIAGLGWLMIGIASFVSLAAPCFAAFNLKG